MKRCVVLWIACFIFLAGCSVVADSPTFAGTIVKVEEDYITVKAGQSSGEFDADDEIRVATRTRLEDSLKEFTVGDEVRIYYTSDQTEQQTHQLEQVQTIILLRSAEEVLAQQEE